MIRAVDLGGLRLHVSDTGGDGPALFFANSLGTDLRLWDKVAPRFADWRVIRYDMRGHGLSDAPPAPYAMEELVADAAGILDALGVAEAAVVGCSIGGMVAQGLAARRPDLVRAAVLSNTATRFGTSETWEARIAAVRAGGIASIAEDILARWFAPPFRDGDEIALWRNMLARTPVEGYAGCCAALATADLSAETAGIACPVLAVAGGADGSSPPDVVRAMAALIPGAEVALIEAAGHLPAVDAPEAFADAVAPFLARHRPG